MGKSGLIELNAVVAVARHRSFRLAATELGLSPSALSHAIATLEKRLEVRLFNRTTRSVTLSQAGEAFLARVAPALRAIDDAFAAAPERDDQPTGTLRINTSAGAARMVLMPLVIEYLRCYPTMQVELACDERFVDIVDEGFDAGVRGSAAVPKDMVAVGFGPAISYAVVASPAYWTEHGRPRVPGDLTEHACLQRRLANGTILRWEFEKRRDAVTLEVRGPLVVDQDELLLQAALAGVGVACMIEWAVTGHVRDGRLEQVLRDWTPCYPGLSLYHSSHRQVPARLRAFIDLLRERDGQGRLSRVSKTRPVGTSVTASRGRADAEA